MKAVAKTVEPADREARFDHIPPHYLEALTLVERLHRRLLDVIKDEFDRRGRADINSVQALLLYNIGEKELTAGELRTRGYYLGSNVSYNLKKLVEMGFLDHQRSRVDRRSVRIKVTEKGREVRDTVDALYQRQLLRTAKWSRSAQHQCRRVQRAQQGAAPARAVLDRSDSLSAVRVIATWSPVPLRGRVPTSFASFLRCTGVTEPPGVNAGAFLCGGHIKPRSQVSTANGVKYCSSTAAPPNTAM